MFGCNDYDDDGYADSVDTCNNIRGFSWLGRTGCGDFDQDGWSDNKISYQNGDIFTDNWKQVLIQMEMVMEITMGQTVVQLGMTQMLNLETHSHMTGNNS